MAEQNTTLCWSCKNSVPDTNGAGCMWSWHKRPVPGWTATESFTPDGEHYSWNVQKCPKFEKDGEFNLDTAPGDRLQELANAIVISAARNYRNLCNVDAKNRAIPGNVERRALYRGKYTALYGDNYMGMYGELRKAEKFFYSEYARSLTEADPIWIMEEISKEAGLCRRS